VRPVGCLSLSVPGIFLVCDRRHEAVSHTSMCPNHHPHTRPEARVKAMVAPSGESVNSRLSSL